MLKHKHLILALDVKYPPKNAKEAIDYLSFLIQRIDMKIAPVEANPHGYYCDAPGNEGVTASGILETSHTVLHSWDSVYPAKFQFDLYSCKDFDVEFVLALCNSYGILGGTYMILDRDTVLKTIEEGVLGENGLILERKQYD
jgi:hypothetical protein